MEISIKNQMGGTVEFCFGSDEFTLEHEQDVIIPVNDGDCMYLDQMSVARESGMAAQATDAIKAALDYVRDLCGENCSICAGAIGDSRIYNVLVPDKRDLDQIPGRVDVKARPGMLYPWRYVKIYNGVEFYCYESGGEE